MTKDLTTDLKAKAWIAPTCHTLDVSATAGGPPGGVDSHANNGNAGCSPKGCS